MVSASRVTYSVALWEGAGRLWSRGAATRAAAAGSGHGLT